MIKHLIAALLLATGVALAQEQTPCEYWPARESAWIRYQVFAIRAHWNPWTRALSVVSRTPHTEHIISVKWFANSTSIATHFNEEFSLPSDPESFGKLGNISYRDLMVGEFFIGEIGRPDDNLLVAPPEPKIPLNPSAWHSRQAEAGGLTTMHQVLDSRGGSLQTWSMITKFRTLGHYPQWGRYVDCWRTSLEEAEPSGNTGSVYNYVFMRDVGLVDFWYCAPYSPDASGISDGYEYYATDWSK